MHTSCFVHFKNVFSFLFMFLYVIMHKFNASVEELVYKVLQ